MSVRVLFTAKYFPPLEFHQRTMSSTLEIEDLTRVLLAAGVLTLRLQLCFRRLFVLSLSFMSQITSEINKHFEGKTGRLKPQFTTLLFSVEFRLLNSYCVILTVIIVVSPASDDYWKLCWFSAHFNVFDQILVMSVSLPCARK